MSNCDHMNSIVIVAEDNLKRKLFEIAGTMAFIDSRETFGGRFDAVERNVDGNTEFASGRLAVLGVPIRRRLKLGRCFRVEAKSHCQRRS